MGRHLLFRKPNGRFRRAPSLEEMGFDVAKGPRTCNACGHTWHPVLVSGRCPKCDAQDSRDVEDADA